MEGFGVLLTTTSTTTIIILLKKAALLALVLPMVFISPVKFQRLAESM